MQPLVAMIELDLPSVTSRLRCCIQRWPSPQPPATAPALGPGTRSDPGGRAGAIHQLLDWVVAQHLSDSVGYAGQDDGEVLDGPDLP